MSWEELYQMIASLPKEEISKILKYLEEQAAK